MVNKITCVQKITEGGREINVIGLITAKRFLLLWGQLVTWN